MRHRLGDDARNEVIGQGVPARDIAVHVRAHIRYAGTDTALAVEAYRFLHLPSRLASRATLPQGEGKLPPELEAMKSAFEAAHKARFGFVDRRKAAGGRSGVGRGGRRRTRHNGEPELPITTDPCRAPAQTHTLLFRRRLA